MRAPGWTRRLQGWRMVCTWNLRFCMIRLYIVSAGVCASARACAHTNIIKIHQTCAKFLLLCNHVQPINDKWTHVNTTSFHGRKKWRHYVTLCSCHKGYNHKLQSSHGKKAGLLASNRAITFALTRRSYFLGNSIHVQVQILVVVCQWCLMIQDWWPMNPQVYKHHIYKYNHILHSSSNMQVYMNTWAMTSRSSV